MQPQQPERSSQNQIKFVIYVGGVKQTAVMGKEKLCLADKQLLIYDMIGIIQDKSKNEGNKKYTLYSFPRRKKMMKAMRRYVQQFIFQVRDEAGWDENLKYIKSRINNRGSDQSLKLLIVYNPVSGANSNKHLNNITNFMKFTNLIPEIFQTNHRNHCIQYLKTINIKDYCGVAIVSGDGLMHEYVNSFCQLPVTHVPAGSGNAFSKTQMETAGQLCQDEESIFLVIKNKPRPFNLVKYELQKIAEPIYSFLSFQWAMFADFDINSEHLRFLGVLRFEVYAAWLLLKHKRYRGRLSYSTIKRQIPAFNKDLKEDPNYITLEQQFSHTIFCSIPFISQKHKIAPLLNMEEHFIDMQVMKHEAGKYQLFKYLISSDSGTQFNLEQQRPADGYNFIHRKITSFRLEPLDPNQPGLFCIDGEPYESQKVQASLSDKVFLAFV